jgi:hypothetical protein
LHVGGHVTKVSSTLNATVLLPITAAREAATWTIDANGVVSSYIRYTVGSGSGSKHYATGLVVEFADGTIYTAIATRTIGRPLHGNEKGTAANHAHTALPVARLNAIRRVYAKYAEPTSSGPGTVGEWVETAKKWVVDADKIYKELKDTDLVKDAITLTAAA